MRVTTASGTADVDVGESTPRFQCHQAKGAITVAVAGYPLSVYLTGTPDDIVGWAERVADAARSAPPAEV